MSKSKNRSKTESDTEIDTEIDITSLVEATNQFGASALEIYKSEMDSSFVFSAYSIMSVLGMFYLGTSGKTEKSMKKILNLSNRIITSSQLAGLIANLDTLEQVNVFLVRENMFKDLISDYVEHVESIGSVEKFSAKNPKSVVERVNKIVDTTTHHLIKSIITADMITKDTSSILLNCIYFKLKWHQTFNKDNTKSRPFYDGSMESKSGKSRKQKKVRDVDMMSMCGKKFRYVESDDYQLLEMNYQKNEFTFGVLLPKTTTSIIPKQEEIDDLISELKSQKITTLEIPKFRQESEFDIKKLLKTFNLDLDSVDVKNMFDNVEDFGVNQVIHKAVIIVDEEGTEAAAATAKLVSKCITPETPKTVINFVADHPFTYYIRHIEYNIVIFNGYYE